MVRTLILNGSHQKLPRDIKDYVPSETQLIEIPLNDKRILNCTGCMSCVWNIEGMHPGICRLKDDMQEICPTFVHSDLVILLTDIVFGGFSSLLKKTVDRLLPVLFTAPLKKRGIDVGHVMRYSQRPSIMAVGMQAASDDRTATLFQEYCSRLFTLWDVPLGLSVTCALNQPWEENHFLLEKAFQSLMESFR